MPTLHVEEVRGRDAFVALEAAWATLCGAAQCDSFFLSHAWFRALLAGSAADAEVIVLLVRDGSRLVAIVPLLLQPTRWRIFPARQLALMQNQDSPYSDLIALPSHVTPVIHAVLGHLRGRGGWHFLSAFKVRRGSPTATALCQALPDHHVLEAPSGRSPVLHLDGTWEAFWTAQSQRFKKTVRNVANRVERLGRIEIRDEASVAPAAECWELFRRVAARSWKAALPISVTRHAGIARFFEALTATLCDQGRLALWVLRLDGTPIATEYHVRDGRTVYALRSDFDERHGAASPGAHLNAFVVRAYFESDLAVYDMGPGDRDYKQRWATASIERDAFWVFNQVPYARALYAMERRAVPQLRRMRSWWRGPGPAVGTAA